MSDGPPPPPGRGFLGWLGRQVGHVKKAVEADSSEAFERTTVTEVPHPTDPRLTLRRTVTDQAVVNPRKLPDGK